MAIQYRRGPAGEQPISVDENAANADWTKQTWDLPAHSVEELRAYLRARKIDVAHFKTLPVYTLNVNKPGLGWLKGL
jgi:hypothetical protein